MAKDNQPRPIHVGDKIKYKEEYDQYDIQLYHRRNYWWLLLLLLPLLLLIQCKKDISVTCLEPDSGAPIVDQPVSMSYQAHFLWKDGRFFATDSISMTQSTDSTGQTVFRDLPCSIFSYIFYCRSQVSFTAQSECHAAVDERHNFHFTRHVDLMMEPRREDLYVKLLDLETGDPLPDGTLIYRYIELGEQHTDSAHADAAGVAMLPQMRYCSVVDLLGRCHGYADTTRTNVPCQDLLAPNDSTALRLRPIKERFTFFVKNKETRQPIPDAKCIVTLTHPQGSKQQREVHTSIDGKGIAVYDDAFILAAITIHASKIHYKDGDLDPNPQTGNPWTVEEFIPQDDDTRTVWLEPEPYQQEFINVDSITGQPIPGVHNEIRITNPDGSVETFVEISNRNGVFPVTAKEDAKIEIVSTLSPGYKPRRTLIRRFGDLKDPDRKIPMQPEMVTLKFRTVDAESPNTLIPNCSLRCTGSISGNLPPSDSGNGEFNVTFRRVERLSILASKTDAATRIPYERTTDKVSQKDYDYLKVEQERRDIPLRLPLVYDYNQSPSGTVTDCYELHRPCDFLFNWTVCPNCTMIIVKDGNGTELGRFGIDSPGGNGQGIPHSASSGNARMHTSTGTVCVTVTDVNGHQCIYRITRL